MNRIKNLPDQNQNYWQLASIQSAAFGIPVLQFGATLGKSIGTGTAILAIFAGNLLLWLVGLAVVSMTIKSRKNAIENLAEYFILGRWVVGLALFIAFLLWYPIQIESAVQCMRETLSPYLDLQSVNFNIRSGTVIGLLIALVSIGGIKLIKWFNIISLPFLIFFLGYAIISNKSIPPLSFNFSPERTWTDWAENFFSAVFSSAAITLVTIINLPTFFRHRDKEVDAIFAMPIFISITILTECLAVFLVESDSGKFFSEYLNKNFLDVIFVVFFLLVSSICVNLVNIYFASAVWEALIPWVSRAKELAIIGLGGTVIFIFFQSQVIMSYIETLLTTFIGILGIVALIGYALKIIINHRERRLELIINTIYWLVGCFVVIIVQDIKLSYSTIAFVLGITSSSFLLWTTLFIEEMAWGFKKTVTKKKSNTKF